ASATLTAALFGTGVVNSTHILDETIVSADILDGTIVAADIATGGVATDEILDGTIVAADLAAANLDIGAYKLTAETLESDVATGTAPLVVASTTVVANLNASYAATAYGITGNLAVANMPLGGVWALTSNLNVSNALFVNQSSTRVGIGTDEPIQILQVNDVMRLNPTDSPGTCAAAQEGSLYYDNSENNLCICDSSNWVLTNGTTCT
ncbi:MAG: hypothetical protein V1729_00370, partial [Candidatus Woesearchaeota archaeon]